MSCQSEQVRGFLLTSAAVSGVGTAVNIAAAFTGGIIPEPFNTLTVTNDADRPIKVAWTNSKNGHTDYFLVANGGKTITHKIMYGELVSTSLKVYSTDGATAAAGNITINLSIS